MNKILVTGAAGFIGSSLVDRLVADGFEVCGVDDFNDYYDPKIKRGNIEESLRSKRFKIYKQNVLDGAKLSKVFLSEKPSTVVHLAARAGVRPSIANPFLYAQVNALGTTNVLKASLDCGVSKFIFGSTSSVYGNSPKTPFGEDDLCNNIISPYGASKRAAEFLVESFSRSLGQKAVILRFFTVYGPRGRVDMAPALFTKAILKGDEIPKFGDGGSMRDYTYIDDIVEGIIRTINVDLDFEIINLGNSHPISLNEFIKTLEKITGKSARIKKLPKQRGDVEKTWADIKKAEKLLGWKPKVQLETGLSNYVKWLMQKGF